MRRKKNKRRKGKIKWKIKEREERGRPSGYALPSPPQKNF